MDIPKYDLSITLDFPLDDLLILPELVAIDLIWGKKFLLAFILTYPLDSMHTFSDYTWYIPGTSFNISIYFRYMDVSACFVAFWDWYLGLSDTK